jgi:hypothetical protein
MLRGTIWQLFADISEQPIGSSLNNQTALEECKEEVHTVSYRRLNGRLLAVMGSGGTRHVIGV